MDATNYAAVVHDVEVAANIAKKEIQRQFQFEKDKGKQMTQCSPFLKERRDMLNYRLRHIYHKNIFTKIKDAFDVVMACIVYFWEDINVIKYVRDGNGNGKWKLLI